MPAPWQSPAKQCHAPQRSHEWSIGKGALVSSLLHTALTHRQDAAEERHMDAIRMACFPTRHVAFFEGDPRGHTVYIATAERPMRHYATPVPTS